ncbi:unnamed protein product [Ciceribacter selenitireducens ATCC BAA-1503]|uniref:Uncharacterized protein n=1 Tax=Ciceribacter selenitireducens ATCC BAA-1503 TaxID=1336235 RepID=A0A376AK12_9HYPH|nr:unnamed protein product [Ciceribacter selenitireducens ATCC BAA-1503]
MHGAQPFDQFRVSPLRPAAGARLADVFRKAGFTRFRRALETPFNLVLEAKL